MGTVVSRRRRATVAAATVAVLALGAACSDSNDDNDAASTTSTAAASGAVADGPVVIQAGINDPAQRAVAVLQYMPSKVTVAVGQTVRWSWDGTTEPHSVTFFPPGQTAPPPGSDEALFAPTPATGPYDGSTLVNSGLAPLGPDAVAPFDVSFAKPGTYAFQCVIHPQMVGTATVVAAGGEVDSAAAARTRGDQEKGQWLAEGRAAYQQLQSAPAASTRNADGTTTWTVMMGASSPHTDVLAFAPVPATAKAGDQVTFVNASGAPHTATFFGRQPPITSPVDPRVGTAIPGPSPQKLNAADLFNTGLLPPDAPPGAGPPLAARSFTFSVPAAGSYSYVCLLHAPSGMAGVITAS